MNINDDITITFTFFVALYAVTTLNNTVIYIFTTHYDDFNTVLLLIASLSETNYDGFRCAFATQVRVACKCATRFTTAD
jgi:hypothetical protein